MSDRGNTGPVNDGDLQALVAEAMCFDGTYAIKGESNLGWWTGHDAAGQAIVATFGEGGDLFTIVFDRGGREQRIERFAYDLDVAAPLNHRFAPAATERSLRRKFPGFTSGIVRVRPFWIGEKCDMELHPLPDWLRPWVDGGYPFERWFDHGWSRQELWDWLTEDCCQVQHNGLDTACWYNAKAEVIG
jgi:hypothetical protein